MAIRPVVFLPGYYGSTFSLKSTQEIVWVDLKNIFSPARVMSLLRLGQPEDSVFVSDILDSIDLRPFFCLHIYRKLKRFLKRTLDYPSDWVIGHPIDWRQSLGRLADDVERQLKTLAPQGGKIDLLCHSHGGLVGRAYLAKYGGDRVGRLITLGTPHHGMLKVLEALDRGIDLFTFDRKLTKPTARSMPSAYELLPRSAQQGLFTWDGQASDPLSQTEWVGHEPDSATRDQMLAKLKEAKASTNQWLPAQLDVSGYFIYGTRLETMVNASGTAQQPLQFHRAEEGDNTVATVSGRGGGIAGSIVRCPAPFANHTTIFNEPYVRRLLKSILLEERLPEGEFQVVAQWQNRFYFPNTVHKIAVEVRDLKGEILPNAQVHLKVYRSNQSQHPLIETAMDRTAHGDFLGAFRLPPSDKPLRWVVRIENTDLPGELHTQSGFLRMR